LPSDAVHQACRRIGSGRCTGQVRFAAALDSLRVELRGMNERLDRIIENIAHQKE